MFPVDSLRVGVSVGYGVWVKYPNIKKGSFEGASPYSILAAMSRRAPGCVLALAPARFSPVTGNSSGSVQTLLQTSLRRSAVKSRISLCRMDGKPPFAHERACSTVKEEPQAHFEGSFLGVQP